MTIQPALAVEMVDVDQLVPDPLNSRRHSKQQIAMLAGIIREAGFCNPIMVDANLGILAGHGRQLAAKKAGLRLVPVIRLTHLTEAQRRAYIIADNRMVETSDWDLSTLKGEVDRVLAEGFALESMGFTADSFADLMAPLKDDGGSAAGAVDPDDLPSETSHTVSRPGDIWLLGDHRLGCGDSTDAAAVGALLAGVRPGLMVTSPPPKLPQGDAKGRRSAGAPQPLGPWTDALALYAGPVAYVWHSTPAAVATFQALQEAGLAVQAEIIWSKTRRAAGKRAHYGAQHESCWYAVREGVGYWSGGAKESTLWQLDPVAEDLPGQGRKPVLCMQRAVENSSSPGQSVYDPFVGSFTTGIACERSRRSCIGMDILPAQVDMGVRRWQAFTGREAVLEADGRTFREVEDAGGRE